MSQSLGGVPASGRTNTPQEKTGADTPRTTDHPRPGPGTEHPEPDPPRRTAHALTGPARAPPQSAEAPPTRNTPTRPDPRRRRATQPSPPPFFSHSGRESGSRGDVSSPTTARRPADQGRPEADSRTGSGDGATDSAGVCAWGGADSYCIMEHVGRVAPYRHHRTFVNRKASAWKSSSPQAR